MINDTLICVSLLYVVSIFLNICLTYKEKKSSKKRLFKGNFLLKKPYSPVNMWATVSIYILFYRKLLGNIGK